MQDTEVRFTIEEVTMLLELLEAPGVAVPVPKAQIAAELYGKLLDARELLRPTIG